MMDNELLVLTKELLKTIQYLSQWLAATLAKIGNTNMN